MKRTPGRPRNASIDQAVLSAAREHLAAHGYEAMSVLAVANEAGTTRQALYRRWQSKADLATAAIASMPEAAHRQMTDAPFDDLVAELASFFDGVRRPNGIGMVGAMLHEGVDPELRALYRERVVDPRRSRIRAILELGIDAGILDSDADLDSATAAATGTLYGLQLAGAPITDMWPIDTAALIWRACGGTPPTHGD